MPVAFLVYIGDSALFHDAVTTAKEDLRPIREGNLHKFVA